MKRMNLCAPLFGTPQIQLERAFQRSLAGVIVMRLDLKADNAIRLLDYQITRLLDLRDRVLDY